MNNLVPSRGQSRLSPCGVSPGPFPLVSGQRCVCCWGLSLVILRTSAQRQALVFHRETFFKWKKIPAGAGGGERLC